MAATNKQDPQFFHASKSDLPIILPMSQSREIISFVCSSRLIWRHLRKLDEQLKIMPSNRKSTPSKPLRRSLSLRSIKQNCEPTTSFEPQPDSRLLQLPAELRNTIYEYALTYELRPEQRIYLHELRLPYFIFTCRQTLFETAGIFFTCNPFTLMLRETEHARIPKLLDPVAANAMDMLHRFGVQNIPTKDIRIEKQQVIPKPSLRGGPHTNPSRQPLCLRARPEPVLILLATPSKPSQPSTDASWLNLTSEVWTTWRPKLES